MNIFAVIVTYNAMHRNWIDRCLQSLRQSSVPVTPVIVDNNSTDGTREHVPSHYPEAVWLPQDHNLGFGQANNVGIRYALSRESDYVLLLNQDATISSDALERMLSASDGDSLLSPLHLNGDGTRIDEMFRFSLRDSKNTMLDDLLIRHDIAAAGYTQVWENCAETSNKGFELNLNGVILQKKNFSLNANFNIGFDRSNVEKVTDELTQMTFASGWAGTDNKNQMDYIVKKGEPIGLIYGWKNAGYYTTADFEGYDAATNTYILKDGVPTCSLFGGAIGIRPGTIKLQDISGPNGTPDGVIDTNDITVIGDTNPSFSGGFGLSGTIYDFDFSANFTYTVGNDIYNANKIAASQQYRSGTYPNMLNFMRQGNSYSYMNPETGTLLTSLEDLAFYNEGGNGQPAKEYWSPYSFGSAVVMPTEWAIEDASFLRLQSVTIGYTLPTKLTKKIGVERLRFYATGTNLFCITNYTGFDPEVSSYVRNSSYSGITPGIDYSSYPKSRAFTFGVNVSL